MGRALAAIGGLLVLCFAVLLVVVFATREEDKVAVDANLAERITRAIGEAGKTREDVDLRRLAPFGWDEVLVVRRGTSVAQISRAIGFEFRGDLGYTAESGELLVFLEGGELRRFADYRGRGGFVGLETPIARLTPAEAVFEVRGGFAAPKR